MLKDEGVTKGNKGFIVTPFDEDQSAIRQRTPELL